MINLFNQKELLVTMKMERQSQVRDILAQNNIDYIVRTRNLEATPVIGSRRAQTGSFGINQDYTYEYKIYVHKKDFERASYLIR